MSIGISNNYKMHSDIFRETSLTDSYPQYFKHEIQFPNLDFKDVVAIPNIVENQYLTYNNQTYVKVFDHNVSGAPSSSDSYFTDAAEAKHCFKPNKFSRLGDLDSDLFRSTEDNKYEFLLMYPDAPLSNTLKPQLVSLSTLSEQNKVTFASTIGSWSISPKLKIENTTSELTFTFKLSIIGNVVSGMSLTLYPQIGTRALDNKLIFKYSTNAVKSITMQCMLNNNSTALTVKIEAKSSNNTVVYSCEETYKVMVTHNGLIVIDTPDNGIVSTTTKISVDSILSEFRQQNIWRQSYSPFIEDYPSDGGYEAVYIAMPQRWGKGGSNDNPGYGLRKNQAENPASLFDTQPNDAWWYGGLGQYSPYSETDKTTGFPAPDGNIYQHVQLWVRVNNTRYDARAAILKDAIYMDEFIEN